MIYNNMYSTLHSRIISMIHRKIKKLEKRVTDPEKQVERFVIEK